MDVLFLIFGDTFILISIVAELIYILISSEQVFFLPWQAHWHLLKFFPG
jgi:hypothetical protein